MLVKTNGCHANPDGALPRADTCFFNLELPLYSSAAVLKDRLLTAIRSDVDSLDADRLEGGPDMGGQDGGWFSDREEDY